MKGGKKSLQQYGSMAGKPMKTQCSSASVSHATKLSIKGENKGHNNP
jgi:hypothetical protein